MPWFQSLIPKLIGSFRAVLSVAAWVGGDTAIFWFTMFVIEALHPDGWRCQGRHEAEYWAYQEAQARCCSDGRNYRILNGATGQLVALINTSSCRQAAVAHLLRP